MQKIARAIAEWLVYSNIWISTGAIAFSQVSAFYLAYELPQNFLIFIFSTTLFAYNFQRLVKLNFSDIQPISGPRATWIIKHMKFVYALMLGSGIASLFFGWEYILKYSSTLAIIGLFTFFYVWKVPILKRNLRSIPGLKIFILGLTWVLACQILPYMAFSTKPIHITSISYFLSSFLFIFSISIPFDIRDVEVDDQKMKTFPQILGVRKAKIVAIIFLILSFGLVTIMTQKVEMGLIISTIITSIVVIYSEKSLKEMYFSGLVDGMLILQFVFIYFFQK